MKIIVHTLSTERKTSDFPCQLFSVGRQAEIRTVNACQEWNMAHNLPETRGCQPEGEMQIMSHVSWVSGATTQRPNCLPGFPDCLAELQRLEETATYGKQLERKTWLTFFSILPW
jgi:hypothetical protein